MNKPVKAPIKLKKIDTKNSSDKQLRELVYLSIREAILTGDLKPGQHLMEIKIAEQLGVSRTPVRESLRQLELEGFVTMIPKRGAFVTLLSIKDLSEMMQIRGVLEALAAKLATTNASDYEVSRLKKLNSQFEQAAIENNNDEIIDSDVQFHDVLYRASGNERLAALINQLRDQMHRMRSLYVDTIEDKKPLIGQHEKIISAIEQGDEKAAEQEAFSHIKQTEEDMLRVLSDLV